MSNPQLLVFPPPKIKEILNLSPFGMKSEAFLALSGTPFEMKTIENPSKFPKAKLPVLKHKGKVIGDSSIIQDYLEKELKISMDDHLSPEEKATGFGIQKMAEEFLYWSVLWERWFIPENWKKNKEILFASVPSLIRGLVANMVAKGVKKAAWGHGMGRHSNEEIHNFGTQCIDAISNFLGEKKFLMGDKVSSFDASIWSFAANVVYSNMSPRLHEYALTKSNLKPYCERMLELYKESSKKLN